MLYAIIGGTYRKERNSGPQHVRRMWRDRGNRSHKVLP